MGVRESDTEEDLPDESEVQPAGRKNYMTPKGFRDLQDEFKHLMRVERPKVVEVVSWAAGNGDRSAARGLLAAAGAGRRAP